MSLRYVLDTGWIIRHLRGSRRYTQTIRKIGGVHLGVSIVTMAELYEGVVRSADPQAAERALTTFLSDKTILPITPEICRVFGERKADLRRRNLLIGDFDLIIGATCLHHHLTLLTTNPKHFRRLPGLQFTSSTIGES